MKTKLEMLLEQNELHHHFLTAIETIEEVRKKKSLLSKKKNEELNIIKHNREMKFDYNSHRISFILRTDIKPILFFSYSPLTDSWSEISCTVNISDKYYNVDVSETTIFKKFIHSLHNLAHQVKPLIEVENKAFKKEEDLKENKTEDLLRRSNLCQLFNSTSSMQKESV